MKFEERLKAAAGTDPGFRVPEHYFDEAFSHIKSSLPERKVSVQPKISRWHKWRPYVYLAAMFAGIWCMMKVVSGTLAVPDISIDNPPVTVAQAMQDYVHSDDSEMYLIESSSPLEDAELIDDMSADYANIDDFEKDFNYDFDEAYANVQPSEYVKKEYAVK